MLPRIGHGAVNDREIDSMGKGTWRSCITPKVTTGEVDPRKNSGAYVNAAEFIWQ
jgi:hypothetical protein